MTIDEKITFALAHLLEDGITKVTQYKLSLVCGVNRSTISKHFKKIKKAPLCQNL